MAFAAARSIIVFRFALKRAFTCLRLSFLPRVPAPARRFLRAGARPAFFRATSMVAIHCSLPCDPLRVTS